MRTSTPCTRLAAYSAQGILINEMVNVQDIQPIINTVEGREKDYYIFDIDGEYRYLFKCDRNCSLQDDEENSYGAVYLEECDDEGHIDSAELVGAFSL